MRNLTPKSTEELEERLSAPPNLLTEHLAELDGDILFLGVGGKMGPTMARMARRASDAAGVKRRVIGVSRFQSGDVRERLESWGVETIACDLLDKAAVAELPPAAHVIYMSGLKFGAADNPPLTWAMNCLTPAYVSRRYSDSRLVAFSTGNVYGLTSVGNRGSKETDSVDPIGEYAMTALGRERIFEYFSQTLEVPLTLLRLNYATELRYGVLVDIALAVRDRKPIDVSMAHVNVIWLMDANAMTLQALTLNHQGSKTINLAGPDFLSVKDIAEQFGEFFGEEPIYDGRRARRSLLSNGQLGYELLGRPVVGIDAMMEWTAHWVHAGGELLGKPTHFEVRDGKF